MISMTLHAQIATEHYSWQHVKLGGGGAQPGIVFHPVKPDVRYILGDVGGPWKWNAKTEQWEYMMYWVPYEEKFLHACTVIACDPNDTSGLTLYMINGKFPDVYNQRGKLHISHDGGKSWRESAYRPWAKDPQLVNQILQVDPFNSNILYLASREGLFISFDKALTFRKLDNVPEVSVGEIQQYNSGTKMVFVDKSAGSITIDGIVRAKRIYVTVVTAPWESALYVSNDGCATWTKEPTLVSGVFKMASDKQGILYAAGNRGVFTLKDNSWIDITPMGQSKNFNCIDVDPFNDNRIICGSYVNGPGSPVYLSNDQGKTWIHLNPKSVNTFQAPWYPKDHAFSGLLCVKFNPHKRNEVWYTDWYHPVMTNDISADTVRWLSIDNGYEELVQGGIGGVSTPSGNSKFHVLLADVGGFRIDSLQAFPKRNLYQCGVKFNNGSGIDYMGSKPSFMVICGSEGWDGDGQAGYSTDEGKTWQLFPSFPQEKIYDRLRPPAGRIVVSSASIHNGAPAIVWGNYTPHFSWDLGKTWQPCNVKDAYLGDPRVFENDNYIASDKVIPDCFYIFSKGNLLRSKDGGANFEKVSRTTGMNGRKLMCDPFAAGNLWLGSGGDKGLWKSTDGGVHWTKIQDVTFCETFSLGKGPDSKKASVYIFGIIKNQRGVYRSDDSGTTWIRIDDPTRGYSNEHQDLLGDNKVWKRVYFITRGNGVWYGEPFVNK